MKGFIQLTSKSGQKVFVNTTRITHICKSTVNDKCTICFSAEDYFETEETYEEIKSLIFQYA